MGHYLNLTVNQVKGQEFMTLKESARLSPRSGGGQGAKTGLYAVPLKYLERNQKNFQGDYSFTIDSVNTGGIMKDKKIRRLTPTECERLQGFPDGWTEGLSDSQRYKCLGNAVTVNVIEAIMTKVLVASTAKRD